MAEGFEYKQGELLWQAMSEQARELGIDDSNICSLLVDALNLECIKDFNAVEFGTNKVIHVEDSYKWDK